MDRSVRFSPLRWVATLGALTAASACIAMAVPALASAVTHGTINGWQLKGSVTDKALGQTISLPSGCSFKAELTIPGELEGNTACPAFTDSATILGFLPAKLGLTLTESTPITATITPSGAHNSGIFTLKGTANDYIGVTSVTMLGLTLNTSCTTKTPVSFPLETTESGIELLSHASFTGTTTLPSVVCANGGLLGSALGPILTSLVSGSGNPFTLSVEESSSIASTPPPGNFQVPYGLEAMTDFAGRLLFNPTKVVGGNEGCIPSTEHPYPVVLVHGTAEDEGDNWVTLAPLLADSGYCVYALNYGVLPLSFGERIDGINHIANSAAELSTFVNKVLAETGASKVDIVGHSQGGMMPNYYIKNLGGAAKVNDLVALAPSNHGTTVSGLTNALSYIESIPGIGLLASFGESFVESAEPAWTEQEETSAFIKGLFPAGQDPVVAGVNYTVIESTKDEVVTPYTNAFLSAGSSGASVTNVTIQNQCPSDSTGHIGIIEDGPATQDVLNALSQSPVPFSTFHPACTNYGIAL